MPGAPSFPRVLQEGWEITNLNRLSFHRSYTDSVTGTWSNLGYDSVNRLIAGTQTAISGAPLSVSQSFCWSYDSFGNRTAQATGSQPFTNAPGAACQLPSGATLTGNTWTSYTAANQISGTNARGVIAQPVYDAAGNITYDGANYYAYDGEGQVCAVGSAPLNSITAVTQYIYDAEGARVAKGSAHTVLQGGVYLLSCDTTANGFTPTNAYVLGPGNEQLTETDGNGNWIHTNVYAAGQLIATYTQSGSTQPLYFQLADWLGTKRVQTDYQGNNPEYCTNGAFGDNLVCSGTADATEHHFTGKERDTESGNDYFGARYYASTMGRFMSPDWSAKMEPVPYAKLDNPQTLNLYAYVGNNPLGGADPDGHCDISCQFSIVMGIVNGIRRDGSVGAYAKNVGTGILKGAGSAVVNTARLAAAGTNPGAIAAAVLSPGPKALQPSNTTQAQASLATQLVLPAVAGMGVGALSGEAAAAPGEAASFFHYGYMADEANFAGGLRAGAFATTDGGLTGSEAQSTLALPNRISGVPDAVYPVTPDSGTPVNGPTTVQPANGYPGGGQEVTFPQGTGPGTVGPPKQIPQQ